MIDLRSKRARRIAGIIFILALVPTLWFAMRSYRTFVLLRSAYALGSPEISSVRGWMTLRYVAGTYRVPADALAERLALSPASDLDLSIKTIAERKGESPFIFVQRVQGAIVEIAPGPASAREAGETSGWFSLGSEEMLSAFLRYGYPAFGLTLLLGALGLPVPTGLATALAGSLAAQGHIDWRSASAIAVSSSIVGDLIGYAIGYWLGQEFLDRRGRWIGYTPARRARVQALFDRWGGPTVLITRTLVSHLSSVVSLLAGISRYRLAGFLAFAVLGRVVWTSAYLGLGYGVGHDLEAATGFLGNFTGLLVCLAILAMSGLVANGRVAARADNPG